MTDKRARVDAAYKSGTVGACFGVFVFPIIWVIALFAFPAYSEPGQPIKDSGSLLAVLFMVPLAIVGGIVFGGVGALIGYLAGRAKQL